MRRGVAGIIAGVFGVILAGCGDPQAIRYCASHGYSSGYKTGWECPIDGALIQSDCQKHDAWHLRHGDALHVATETK